MSKRARLAWFAAVAFVAIFGVGNLFLWIRESVEGPSWWAIDFQILVDAANRLLDGSPLYSDPKFLYSPLAAVVGLPLTRVDPFAASVAYAVLKVALAAVCTAALTPGWPARDRAIASVGVVTCLPLVPAVLGASRFRNGILLGLVAAAFAKPFVVPVLLWLLVWRRSTFLGAAVAGLAATAAAVLVTGPGSYAAWAEALAAGSRYATVFAGNHGVTALVPELWAPVAAAVALGLVLVLWRRGPRVALA